MKRNGLATFFFAFLLSAAQMSASGAAWAGDRGAPEQEDPDHISVERLDPGPEGGWAYRLTYTARAPVDVYWRFKTDFDNDFLLENKFISGHRLVSRSGNTIVTEDEYTARPDVVFRWKTTLSPENYCLDFVLLNPETTGHEFHHGRIRLAPHGENKYWTRVVQEAWFDFFGATFWVIYPWAGGMKDFLEYTARWERETAVKLKDMYTGNPADREDR